MLVDRDDVSLWASKSTEDRLAVSNDRMSFRAVFEREALAELCFQECVESILSSSRRINRHASRTLRTPDDGEEAAPPLPGPVCA
jgi:hypothetical protein